MRTFVRSKNWRRERITPPVLKRIGVRVEHNQRNLDRDFHVQTTTRQKAWVMWVNIHKDNSFESILKKWKDNGMLVYVERSSEL